MVSRSKTFTAASVVLLAACSTTAPSAAESTPPQVIERGREALQQSGVSGELRLVSSEPAQWPDSSLGCPHPNMMYMQVVTSGHALRFASADGRRHEVHVADSGAVVCSGGLSASGRPRVPGTLAAPRTGRKAQDMQALIDKARQDLAGHLDLSVEDVKLLDFETALWPDASLGCAVPSPDGGAAGNAAVPGLKIFLMARGEPYTYHTDSTRVAACPPIAGE